MIHKIPISILARVLRDFSLITESHQKLLEAFIVNDNAKGFFNTLGILGFLPGKLELDDLGPCKDLTIDLDISDDDDVNLKEESNACKSIW